MHFIAVVVKRTTPIANCGYCFDPSWAMWFPVNNYATTVRPISTDSNLAKLRRTLQSKVLTYLQPQFRLKTKNDQTFTTVTMFCVTNTRLSKAFDFIYIRVRLLKKLDRFHWFLYYTKAVMHLFYRSCAFQTVADFGLVLDCSLRISVRWLWMPIANLVRQYLKKVGRDWQKRRSICIPFAKKRQLKVAPGRSTPAVSSRYSSIWPSFSWVIIHFRIFIQTFRSVRRGNDWFASMKTLPPCFGVQQNEPNDPGRKAGDTASQRIIEL